LSNTNPLIGSPDGYPVVYPWGALVSGTAHTIDYRAAIVNLPFYHPGYTPEPGSAPRIVLVVGITPITRLRLGNSFTCVLYLGSATAPALLLGQDWKAYKQLVLAGDVRFSRGYFEFQGEFGYSRHQAPGFPDVEGYAYYGEVKYTFSPRAF